MQRIANIREYVNTHEISNGEDLISRLDSSYTAISGWSNTQQNEGLAVVRTSSASSSALASPLYSAPISLQKPPLVPQKKIILQPALDEVLQRISNIREYVNTHEVSNGKDLISRLDSSHTSISGWSNIQQNKVISDIITLINKLDKLSKDIETQEIDTAQFINAALGTLKVKDKADFDLENPDGCLMALASIEQHLTKFHQNKQKFEAEFKTLDTDWEKLNNTVLTTLESFQKPLQQPTAPRDLDLELLAKIQKERMNLRANILTEWNSLTLHFFRERRILENLTDFPVRLLLLKAEYHNLTQTLRKVKKIPGKPKEDETALKNAITKFEQLHIKHIKEGFVEERVKVVPPQDNVKDGTTQEPVKEVSKELIRPYQEIYEQLLNSRLQAAKQVKLNDDELVQCGFRWVEQEFRIKAAQHVQSCLSILKEKREREWRLIDDLWIKQYPHSFQRATGEIQKVHSTIESQKGDHPDKYLYHYNITDTVMSVFVSTPEAVSLPPLPHIYTPYLSSTEPRERKESKDEKQ